MGIRARVEKGRHQCVRVEVALEVERGPGSPGVPDRADREDELTHARGRFRPLHRVTALDVGLDLGAETEREAPPRERLYVVCLQRDRHRVTSKGDDDRRADLDALGALGRDGAAEKGIDLRFEGPPAVIAVALRLAGGVGRRVDGRVIGAKVDFHRGFRPTRGSAVVLVKGPADLVDREAGGEAGEKLHPRRLR